MNRILLTITVLLAATVPAQAQRPGQQARREMLQGQIVQRFVTNASSMLGLDSAGRERLQQHLRESGRQRRELAQLSAQLRRRMIDSVRDPSTSDDELRRLLAETTALREREDQLWKDEQDALSRFLTPRQQVQFVFMWLRFNDQVRDMALRPPGAGQGRKRP